MGLEAVCGRHRLLTIASARADRNPTVWADPNPQVRLVASYESGLTRVTTLSDGLAGWTIDKKTASVTHDSQVRPVASFVLDAIRGDEQAVNLHRLKSTISLLGTRCDA